MLTFLPLRLLSQGVEEEAAVKTILSLIHTLHAGCLMARLTERQLVSDQDLETGNLV